MSAASNCYIDGEALIRAKRRGRPVYERLVAFYRSRGATYAEIAAAMASAKTLVSALYLGGGGR